MYLLGNKLMNITTSLTHNLQNGKEKNKNSMSEEFGNPPWLHLSSANVVETASNSSTYSISSKLQTFFIKRSPTSCGQRFLSWFFSTPFFLIRACG